MNEKKIKQMKKTILLLALTISFIGLAQETKSSISDRKHEIKVGGIKLLAGPIFEGTYEYIHSKDFTFGSSIAFNLNKKINYPEDFSITPFARFYFTESKEYGAKGFFVEGFAKYATGSDYLEVYDFNEISSSIKNDKYSAGAIGLSIGKKWVNNSGFVVELLGGIGRTLGNSNIAPELFFRGDLNIGYRF